MHLPSATTIVVKLIGKGEGAGWYRRSPPHLLDYNGITAVSLPCLAVADKLLVVSPTRNSKKITQPRKGGTYTLYVFFSSS